MAFCRDSAFCLSEGCPYCLIEWVQYCSTIWWSFSSSVWLLFLIPPTRCHYLHLTERILLDHTVIKKIACVFTCKYWIKAVCYCCARLPSRGRDAGAFTEIQLNLFFVVPCYFCMHKVCSSQTTKIAFSLFFFFPLKLRKMSSRDRVLSVCMHVCTYVYTHTCIEISRLILLQQ